MLLVPGRFVGLGVFGLVFVVVVYCLTSVVGLWLVYLPLSGVLCIYSGFVWRGALRWVVACLQRSVSGVVVGCFSLGCLVGLSGLRGGFG